MGRPGGVIAVAASLLLASCGGSGDGEFSPTLAEEFIRDKARADVRSNPALDVRAPEEPSVTCREKGEGQGGEDATLFTCDVVVVGQDGSPIARQTWEALVELEPMTGDSVVRNSRRIDSTIDPPPSP